MKETISKKETVIVIIGIILFMQNWLIQQSGVWGYVDELIALLSLVYYLSCCYFSHKIPKSDKTIFFLFVFTMVFGLLFNIISGVQKNVVAIIEDVFSIYKFLFVYFGMNIYLVEKGFDTHRIIKKLVTILKFYLFVLIFCAFLNLFINIGVSSEVRYGIRDFAFIYGTPGHLINQMTYSLMILYAEREYLKKDNRIWVLFTAAIMLSTLKTRAFILVFLYVALYYFFMIKKKKNLNREIIIILIAIFVLGISQFKYYFMQEGTPRQMFVAGAVEVVKEYFPLGAGFATYGSSAAAHHYSPLYYKLGFSERWGMTKKTPQYLNDNYLPMIFGEFGLIIAIVFLLLIYKYCYKLIKRATISKSINFRFITYFFVGDMILSSVQSSYLAHYSAVTLSIFYFLFFNKNKEMKKYVC